MTTDGSSDHGFTVLNGNWGAATLVAISDVLQSVYEGLTEAFRKTPDSPIEVSKWELSYPQLIDDARPYQIYLSARDTYWSMYAYQFAHELCHILIGFDRFKGHKHRWFDETLCEIASLYSLNRISESWAEDPPPNVYRALEFAPHHREYAERLEAKRNTLGGSSLAEWFSQHLRDLEADRYRRDLNGVLAVALLPSFREDPGLWRECGELNTWDPNANRSFSGYLDSWTKQLRKQGLVARAPWVVRRLLGLSDAAEQVAAMAIPDQGSPFA